MSDTDSTVDRLGRALGHAFVDAGRAERALSHPSFSHETAAGDRGNERLEFLGDAVLDLVVGEALYHAHPDWPEGRLTRARAAWVRRESLADRARELGLPELVRLGRTELLSGGADKDSILANTLEAVVGALYLDAGLAPVERLVRGWLDAEADGRGAGGRDAKTAFQEWAHARFRETPSYHTVTDSGVEADEQRFTVEVRISGEAWGAGTARSKRLAERAAAEAALVRAGFGMSAYRAGVVAILGRPNAGKSTLLNAILGEKLAIVTAKPQTTRSRILGIHTRPDAQLLFVDTPGLHESERVMNGALIGQALEAGDDCDVALLLVDLTGRWGADHTALLSDLESKGKPVLVVGTKDDLAKDDVVWPPAGVERAFRVSARRREGVDAVVDAVAALLPESPPLYPEDDLSDRPLRFLVAELVREAAFESLEQELPYVLAVEIEQFDESRPELVKIRANLIVERKSQKPIVIGREGRRIKRIGTRARHEIEKLLDTRVHLELWVKIEPNWTKKPARIESLGYV